MEEIRVGCCRWGSLSQGCCATNAFLVLPAATKLPGSGRKISAVQHLKSGLLWLRAAGGFALLLVLAHPPGILSSRVGCRGPGCGQELHTHHTDLGKLPRRAGWKEDHKKLH